MNEFLKLRGDKFTEALMEGLRSMISDKPFPEDPEFTDLEQYVRNLTELTLPELEALLELRPTQDVKFDPVFLAAWPKLAVLAVWRQLAEHNGVISPFEKEQQSPDLT